MFTVIIPAKNESANISRCIDSIFLSSARELKVEVIVVDNGSTDDTVQLAEKAGARVYINAVKNISGLRNLGVQKSHYSFLAFLDADCEVPPKWLINAKHVLEEDKVGIVGEVPMIPKKNVSWIEKTIYAARPKARRKVKYLGSCNMFMKRELFNIIGGFDEYAITGEDYILCQNLKELGFDIIASPELSVFHYGYPKTLKSYFKREIWHGMGMIDLFKAGKCTMPLVWSILNIIFFFLFLFSLIAGYYFIAIFSVLFLLLLPLGSSLLRMYRMGKCTNIIRIYIIYVIYGIARTVSLLKIFMPKGRLVK